MKRVMMSGLLISAILYLSGCSDMMYLAVQPQTLTDAMRENFWSIEWNDIKDDYEDINQEIQIYSAEGELLLTITDNEEIFVFIRSLEYDKWDYSVSQIPPDALKLCTRVSRLEQNGQMITQAVSTVYYDQNGYYHLTEAPGGISQNKMSDQAALYLIGLTGLELTSTERFSDHEMTVFADDNGVTPEAKH